MKLVKESISFTRNKEPIKNLGVGTLNKYGIKIKGKYVIGKNGMIHIDDIVNFLNVVNKDNHIIRTTSTFTTPIYTYKGDIINYESIMILYLEYMEKERNDLEKTNSNINSLIHDKLVKESINFNRQEDPYKSLGIGYFPVLNREKYFGFGTFGDKFGDLTNNTGGKNLYIDPEFGNLILEKKWENSKSLQFKNEYDFYSTYKQMYKLSYYFRETVIYTKGNETKLVYRTIGSSGSHGICGGEATQREYLGKRIQKKCLGELYDYLLNVKIKL